MRILDEDIGKLGERRFETWPEARAFLQDLDYHYVFRGLGKEEWDLSSSLDRASKGHSKREVEQVLIESFIKAAHVYQSDLPPADDHLSWLALMQHHRLPTRLDWTRSPFVAAFFAADDKQESHFAIWAIDVIWLKRSAIRVINRNSQPRCDESTFLGDPQPFTRFFLVEPKQFVAPIQARYPPSRLVHQKGLFLATGDIGDNFELTLIRQYKADAESSERWGYKVILPDQTRSEVLDDLSRMNIGRASLFPGLDPDLDGFSQALTARLGLLLQKFGHVQAKAEVFPLLREFGLH